MQSSFANHIVQQLAPGSLDALAARAASHSLNTETDNDLLRYEAQQSQRSYQNRKALMSVAFNEAFDDMPIQNLYFHELFDVARSFQDNPHTSDSYRTALQALSRMYRFHEHTPKPERDQHQATELKNFAIIIDKLVAELRGNTV